MVANAFSSSITGRRVAILGGCRTPFLKSWTDFKHLTAIDLGTVAVRELLARTELSPKEIDVVIYSTVIPAVKVPNPAREIALRVGLPPRIPAYTVSLACISSNVATTNAADQIARGLIDVAIVVGAEALSDVPLLFSKPARDKFLKLNRARTLGEKWGALKQFRLRDFLPDAPALAEPSTGLTMGESAEKMAKENRISREAQDRYAWMSHQRASAAHQAGILKNEMAPVYLLEENKCVREDGIIRHDASLEEMAKLKPVFDKKYGTITAANASPLTDGASALLLMSEEKARALGYEPLGFLRAYAYAALDPKDQLLMGPAYATPLALDRAGVTLKDIDLVEMHEAFAASVLSCVQAFESKQWAQEKLGRGEAIGEIDYSKFNVYGGSVAIGHPFAATGARMTWTLLNEMKRRDAQFGLVTACAAGAHGAALIFERK